MQNLSLFESNSRSLTLDNNLFCNLYDYIKAYSHTFNSLTNTKSYSFITSCVFEHIITTTNLSNHEKLYYLLADCLALIGKNNGGLRSTSLPSEDWAERLGCSRSLVFTMQKNLVKKGYFIINKDFDERGRNKRNIITPTLPNSVFNLLNKKFPDKVGDHNPYNPFSECKRAYLDRTKLFIKLNYHLLKIITANQYLNPQGKIMWLGFYARCYKNYMLWAKGDCNVGKYSYNDDSSFSFITSYQELAAIYSCNTKNLSKAIRALEKMDFIKTKNIYIKNTYDDGDQNRIIQARQDKSLWQIALSLPDECITALEKVKNRTNLKTKDIKNELGLIRNNINAKINQNYLIIGGVKFNLNLEQSAYLKTLIACDSNDNNLNEAKINCSDNIDAILPPPNNSCNNSNNSYIDSIMQELDIGNISKVEDKLENTLEKDAKIDDNQFLHDQKTLSSLASAAELDVKTVKSNRIKSDPTFAKSRLLLNKDFKINNSNNRYSNFTFYYPVDNLNFIHPNNHHSFVDLRKFLKSTSNFLNLNHSNNDNSFTYNKNKKEVLINTSNLIHKNNKTINHNALKKPHCFLKPKSLQDFHPLSADDCNKLQILSKREFNLNAMNQILQSVAIKKPHHRFYNKNSFIAYMNKLLQSEIRQTTKINNQSFKIKANYNKNDLIEQFLAKIEDNIHDISKQAQLKRKLVAVLNPNIAYDLMINLIKINLDQINNTITFTLKQNITLTQLDHNIILQQVKTVYSDIVETVEYKIQTHYKPPYIKPNLSNSQNSQTNTKISKRLNNPMQFNDNNIWNKIRLKIIDYYDNYHNNIGNMMDQQWFSKLQQLNTEQNTNTIILKANTNFVRDFVDNNYQKLINQMLKQIKPDINYNLQFVV